MSLKKITSHFFAESLKLLLVLTTAVAHLVEPSPRMRGSNPGPDRRKSLNKVGAAPGPNARQQGCFMGPRI